MFAWSVIPETLFWPSWFGFDSNKYKIGSLQAITLRLGIPIITICLTKRKFHRHIEVLERDNIPTDFYTLKKGKQGYDLRFNYCITGKRIVRKLATPEHIVTYSTKPSKHQIYREIMLNDWSRWNTDFRDNDKIEVSANVYNDMLEALPPRNWKGTYFEVGEPDHHDENGKAVHRALNYVDGKYYIGHPKVIYFIKPA